jgi:hypothetical protein
MSRIGVRNCNRTQSKKVVTAMNCSGDEKIMTTEEIKKKKKNI